MRGDDLPDIRFTIAQDYQIWGQIGELAIRNADECINSGDDAFTSRSNFVSSIQ